MEKQEPAEKPAARTGRWQRQAVVLCHGIGEHRPMDTLTNFVWTIHARGDELAKIESGQQVVRSYPQDAMDNLELRSFSVLERNDCITDYYELYWSHLKARENINFVFLRWLNGILKFKTAIPWNLTKAFGVVRNIRGLLWVVGLAFATALAVFTAMDAGPGRGIVAFAIILAAAAIAAMCFFYLPLVTNVVGDIARYLAAEPENIHSREAIRRAGIDLLDALHDARELDGQFRYDRIIVVGHSLGSIITYDVILNCFAKRNGYSKIENLLRLSPDGKSLPQNVGMKFVSLEEDEKFRTLYETALNLRQEQNNLTLRDIADSFCPQLLKHNKLYQSGSYPERLREAQMAYWRAQRNVFAATRRAFFEAHQVAAQQETSGRARVLDWRVSDFITLGSPLTYASLLLVHDKPPYRADPPAAVGRAPSRSALYAQIHHELEQRARCKGNWPINGELEYAMSVGTLPTSPPRAVHRSVDDKPQFHFSADGRAILTNDSAFAFTRWTNLYFPSDGRVLYGDIVSGPLGPVFGMGIKDVPLDPRDIKARRRPSSFFIRDSFAHTSYWTSERTDWDFVNSLEGVSEKPRERLPLRIKALLDALDLTQESLEWPENTGADQAKG